MTPTSAAVIASSLSFLLSALIAIWYLVPWLKSRSRADALSALLWFHAFRYVALELFSAQAAGLPVPDDLRDQIAYGDLAGSLLSLLAIVALRYRFRFVAALIWVFVAATVVDLLNALLSGVRNAMMGVVHDVPWLVLCFYVPALWVTLALIVWQLVSRSREPLAQRASHRVAPLEVRSGN